MDYKRWIMAISLLFIFSPVSWAEEQKESMAVLISEQNLRGTNGGQLLSVLQVLDQTKNADDWGRYQEFYTESSAYVGEYNFKLPKNMINQSVNKLVVQVNYKGSRYEQQPWHWDLWNYNSKQWVNVGNNLKAPNWSWVELSFDVLKDVKNFIDENGNVKLKYSTNGTDASAMDYLALKVMQNKVSWWQPKVGLSWQYQLTGLIDTTLDADVFVVDMFDTPQSVIDELHAKGRKVVCEVNVGLWEGWRDDASRYPESVLGFIRVDWFGERWVDFRQMDIVGPIVKDRFRKAVEKKCDAIEPDNLDAIANISGFNFTYQEQLVFSQWLAEQAHALGLAIVLKNNLTQIPDLVNHFDIALTEECYEFQECDKLLPFINAGKPVFIVEYNGLLDNYCRHVSTVGFSVIKKDLALSAMRQSCQ